MEGTAVLLWNRVAVMAGTMIKVCSCSIPLLPYIIIFVSCVLNLLTGASFLDFLDAISVKGIIEIQKPGS
jgi:hypothetical protein